MDKDKDRESKTEEIAIRLFGTTNPTWEQMKDFAQKTSQETLDIMDNALKSRWLWGNQRKNLIIFRSILQMQASDTKITLFLLQQVNDLNEALAILGEMAQISHDMAKTNQTATKELQERLAKINTTLAEPRIARVAEVLEQLEKKSQEANKAAGAYSV